MDGAGLGPVRRLPRAQRREQILVAATTAFARRGYAATNLGDIAAEAGITKVLLYRHFDTKADLYQAALDRFCAVLSDHVTEPEGGFTGATIDGLLTAAITEPDGFRLLFAHAAREPEFAAMAEQLHADITEISLRHISVVVDDPQWARWAARLAPTAAIEAILAWLDAGQPDPDQTADRIRQVVTGVITAAAKRARPPSGRPKRRT